MIRPNKGLHVLLRAMERLPGCTLTVAGCPEEAGYFGRVRELAAELPEGRVEWVPRFVDESEIAGFFDRSHLVVLPYTEFPSQSGVLHQAAAHGRPVVASDVGGLGESVRRWGIGEAVPPNDPAALADAVSRALRPESYRAAADATARVRDKLTWAHTAEATLDVYRAVVA
jgi:glycosyltransferase involved in cell wall biosynthesis